MGVREYLLKTPQSFSLGKGCSELFGVLRVEGFLLLWAGTAIGNKGFWWKGIVTG